MTSYLAVGHVCVDELVGREDRLGGTVFFSAGQAAAMGCDVSVLTSCTPATAERARRQLGAAVALDVVDAPDDTRFEFGEDAERGPQRLGSTATRLDDLGRHAGVDVLHLAPVFNELGPALIDSARGRAGFVGATPQGLLRGTSATGALTFVAANWPAGDFADAIVLNDEEYTDLRRIGLLDGFGGLVFRTLGPDGAAVLRHDVELARHRPAPAEDDARPQRTIGAGDVFAAAAFVAMASGDDVEVALGVAVEAATAYVRRSSDAPSFVDPR
ncbi:MAG: PfkB family carbohydrate kinase [Acidimicrobiales bacterium]